MSQFILIAPGDFQRIDNDLIVNSTMMPLSELKDYDGNKAFQLYELTDKLRAAGILTETQELEKITVFEDLQEVWVKINQL